jgi:hypothetical protein
LPPDNPQQPFPPDVAPPSTICDTVISFRERPLLKKLHVIDIAGPVATAAGALAGKYLAPAWAATTHLVTVLICP